MILEEIKNIIQEYPGMDTEGNRGTQKMFYSCQSQTSSEVDERGKIDLQKE